MVPAAQTGLWKCAFEPRDNDENASARQRLRDALLKMRENVATLVTTIPSDCKDLTVHDISHLDALWEMATIIAGPDYSINPAEAFVLGASILLHDAGMSAAAFPGGVDELKSTEIWSDVAAAALRQHELEPTPGLIQNPPAELVQRIKFEVLRGIHASQAEKMATASWKSIDGGDVYLLEDLELRQAFGSAIGRIAHSHHWSIERVAEKLIDNIGPGTVLPGEWSINERKIACILRCADAAHIDRRRAPTILYAATRPSGISDVHWGAQNKLNKPVVSGSTLIYSSGQPFKASEANSWWLAYDLIRLIDKEIRSSNGLLEELGFQVFRVSRVLGADSSRAMAKHIQPDGWRPIDAEIKVSDPVHLASMLGGHHLYGTDPLAPIRELLQNSADAIRARRELEDRSTEFGRIRITVEPVAEDKSACVLYIDDDGIGMTERVMAGPLIDFGRSIWSSTMLREEFPGLQSKSIKPIGKFGIGFFSIFDLGKKIRVVSRHYQSGVVDSKVLEFNSISSRPLIRPALPNELPRDFSTRIAIQIDEARKVFGPHEDQRIAHYPYNPYSDRGYSFEDGLIRLVSMLDIRVEFSDKIRGTRFDHSPDVYSVDAGTFIDEIMPHATERERDAIKAAHADLMVPLTDDAGLRYGRAALNMIHDSSSYNPRAYSGGGVSVGGFVYGEGRGLGAPYIGVVAGDAQQAARRFASTTVPAGVIAKWATSQASLIDQKKFLRSQLLEACEKIISLGGNPGSLPYCLTESGPSTYLEAKTRIEKLDTIRIPLRLDFSTFAMVSYKNIGPTYCELPLEEDVFVLRSADSKFIDDDISRKISKEGRDEIVLSDVRDDAGSWQLLHRDVTNAWGGEPRLTVTTSQIFRSDVYSPPDLRWTLTLRRASVRAAD